MGYGVVAERFARYLVDWGLGDYAKSYDEMTQEFPSLHSAAEERMESIEEFGIAVKESRGMFEIAESLEENGYIYTANWILEEKIVNGLPDPSRVGDIVAMMSEANDALDDIRKSMDDMAIAGLECCLDSAETALDELDLNGSEAFLERILDTTTWQNISSKFVEAQVIIKELEEAGERQAFMAKGNYDRAVKAFGECDHELTVDYLEKILIIPESVCTCVATLWFSSLLTIYGGRVRSRDQPS
jgi:hypothetical protein